MGRDIALETPRGRIGAWRADPMQAPFGALVVLQEIFGLNDHIRAVTDRFAANGYVALAPALFDPVQPGIELGYDSEALAKGRELAAALGFERAIEIAGAAARRLQDEGHRVGVVGYCWGGSVAYLANTRLGLPAVSYYGARTVPFLDEPLRAPMLFHYGETDASIPADDIALHRRTHPDATHHLYPTGHAFNRDIDPAHYHADSASLALRRTLDFFGKHLS